MPSSPFPMLERSRFFIHTFGCKVNRSESEAIAASLISNGWEQADDCTKSDVNILNTCTVTGEADAKNRKMLHSFLRKSASPVIVTGCAIDIDAAPYEDIDARIRCESDKSSICGLAEKLAGHGRRIVMDPDGCTRLRAGSNGDFRTRVDLKIQDGCDNDCSFCIVHVARGPARSKDSRSIVHDAKILADAGVQELVLVGIDIAAYQDGGKDLAGLVETILDETCVGRVRISSVEPQSVDDSLASVLADSNGRLCRHLHLCMQSGSDKILEEMNRRYDSSEFFSLVDGLRSRIPGLALSTDVIVGFPGEDDDDFDRTCDLVERCGFMRLHVFRYSKRPGTPAAERKDQIDPNVKNARSKKLISLGKRLMLSDMENRVGSIEKIIIERPGMASSESYHTVSCDPAIPIGTLVDAEFIDIDAGRGMLIART